MKRAFTQKIGSVPSCAADNEGVHNSLLVDNPSTPYPELTRRVRASATTIGLAIAMAASGMLLPQKHQKVMAAEEFGIAKTSAALPNLESNQTDKDAPSISKASTPVVESTNSSKSQASDKAEVSVPQAPVEQPTPIVVAPEASKSAAQLEMTVDEEPTKTANLGENNPSNSSSVRDAASQPLETVPQPSAKEDSAIPTSKAVYQVKSGDTLENIAENYNTSNNLDTEVSKEISQESLAINSEAFTNTETLEAKEDPEVEVGKNKQNLVDSDSLANRSQANELQAEIETLKEGTEVKTLVAQATPEGVPIAVPEPDTVATTSPLLTEASPAPENTDLASAPGIEIPVPKPESMTSSATKLKVRETTNSPRKISTQNSSLKPLPIRQADTLSPQAEAIEIPVPKPATNFIPNTSPPGRLATGSSTADEYNSDRLRSPAQEQLKDQFLNPSANVTYTWPVNGVITSGFGRRWGRLHAGIDFGVPTGTPVRASAPGVVIRAGWVGAYGNLVEIKHPNGSITRYAHNSELMVVAGQEVQQGDPISRSGNTGRSTGPHVHFEIRPDGKQAVNPMSLLPRRA